MIEVGFEGGQGKRASGRRRTLDSPENASLYWRAYGIPAAPAAALEGETMRKFVSQSILFAALAVLSLAVAGCSQYNGLKAKRAFRDANGMYQASDYKNAVGKYESVVALDEDTLHQFHLEPAYFFLANSYDNMFRSAKRGDAANDGYMTKAVEFYKKDAEIDPDPKMKKLSLQYLVAAYGPDKLNDATQQEPILQQMIQVDPTDPANYFYLANIYEQNGDYEKAEEQFLKAKEMKPNDPVVYTTLAAFYDRQGEFGKVINALNERAQHEPNNPEAHHVIATYYWNEAYKNFKLKDADKMKYIQAGLTEADKALALKPDYFEALTYKNLLLRSEALVEKDPAKQQQLLKEADQLRDKALQLQKQKQAAAATAPSKG
jgi:tetratricopeptide (TPR) repeat protein